ncbi:MAG: chemotaxis protein CheW [Proteobacteria bacterium]|nr:chemotaxis protein CheW [Pseudomonadota bacterium]
MSAVAIDSAETFVTLRLAGQLIGLPIGQVRDVFQIGSVTPIPLAGQSVLGLANLRGRIVLLYSLAGLIGLPEGAPRKGPRMAVSVQWRGESLGIQIDEIGDVLVLPAGSGQPLPAQFDRSWLRHARRIHTLADELMIELDLPSLLETPPVLAA